MMRHSHSTPTIRRLAAALCVVVTMPAAGCFTSVELSFAASDPEVAPKPGEDLHLPGPAELPLLRRRTRRAALPIVLMHGMAGFDKVGGVTYFLGVAPAISEAGYQVFATEVEPFNSVHVRATQAGARIQEILDETGAAKVHIIAHSQGGLDARYLVATLEFADRIASITTIGTPHHGSLLADAALGIRAGNASAAAIALANAIAADATGKQADIDAQLHGLTRKYVEGTFNPQNPDAPGVAYYSYAGVTHTEWYSDSAADTVHPTLLASYLILTNLEGRNDGMVPVESAKWGTFLGAMPADHFDEIGHSLGVSLKIFDHRIFYRELALFLNGDGPAPVFEDERARGTAAMRVGDIFRVQHTFSREDVIQFSKLADGAGSHPPIENPRGDVMVHPLLVAALPPRFAGDLLYVARGTSLSFGHPVYTGDLVTCEARISELRSNNRRTEIGLTASCYGRNGKKVLSGELHGILTWPAPEQRSKSAAAGGDPAAVEAKGEAHGQE